MLRRLLVVAILLLQAAAVLATDPFTLVMLPDTQEYVDRATKKYLDRKGKEDWTPYIFKQVEWTKASKRKLNIVAALHMGDITQTNIEEEWKITKQCYDQFDGVVPLFLAIGNHDVKLGEIVGDPRLDFSPPGRLSWFEKYFPKAKYDKEPWYGGSMDGKTLTNAWYQFEAGGMKFMVVSIEYYPREQALDWANQIVASHPDRRVIVITHAYLNNSLNHNQRLAPKSFARQQASKGNTGEQIFDKFVSRHKNIFLVLCGHIGGEGRQISKGVHGNEVHEVLADYQAWPQGGESWLRYLTFHPDQDKIEVYTYNPALDKHRDEDVSRFTLPYKMTGK